MFRILGKRLVRSHGACFERLSSISVLSIQGVSDSPSSVRPSTRQYRQLTDRYGQRRWYIKPEVTINTDTTVNEDHSLSDYIQTCLSSPDHKLKDTAFHISFLGTGGGIPTKERLCSSTLLRVGGQSFLFDAAEGVQRQLMFTRTSLQSITRIFITHMHGDHIFGLPGLLLYLNLVSKSRRENGKDKKLTVELYGPPGLYNYVAMTLALSMTASTAGIIVVHELVGSQTDPGPARDDGNRRHRREVRHTQYRELERRNLHRKIIRPNQDGTWTLDVPPDVRFKENDPRFKEVYISAAEVQHVEGVVTFGYTVAEEAPRPNIDVEKAKACGIAPGPKYRLLKMGAEVESDDGKRMIQPEEVLSEESKRKARKFALVGDNCQLSPAMYNLCQDCDVLVHEATLIGDVADEAMQRGHSTPGMAGQVARDVNAKVLIMNHISPKVGTEEESSSIMEQAEKTNSGVSSVVVAHDFMEFLVPYKGLAPAQRDDNDAAEVLDDKTTAY